MSAVLQFRRIARAARWRRIAIVALIAAPLIAGVAALASRTPDAAPWPVLLLAGVALAAGIAWRWAARIDDDWVARALDDAAPAFEDSAALLLGEDTRLSPLQRLQRTRLEQRLGAAQPPDLRAAWPRRALALAWMVGVAMLVAAASQPVALRSSSSASRAAGGAVDGAAAASLLVEQRLETVPPTYTGLPPRTESALSARVPQGAKLGWSLRIRPVPDGVALVFHDESRLELNREGDSWGASRILDESTLYRIVLTGAPPLDRDPLYRLDVVADQPPTIRVIAPDRALTLMQPEQKDWSLEFEASDDYGLGDARLDLTLALGGGENVSVKEDSSALEGEGDARLRRYAHKLDLAALGIAAGDDVIARVVVRDKRTPEAQATRSASFILRWPPEASAESSGMEGLVVRTLPAYFRSQRQIIIDSEALIAERLQLEAPKFLSRSEAIGTDQRILRMRYGQFLGEENAEDEAAHVPGAPGEEHEDEAHADEPPATQSDEEQAAAIVAEYGHTHDDAEAATLLDPETRKLLKAALDQMWQAEMHLRLGAPSDALPFEYKALGYIKQVQQASRIYLARGGLELPAIDESRRLTGKREGLGDREDALAPATPPDPLPASLWLRLEPGGGKVAALDAELQSLQRWIREHEDELPDALGLVAAVDTLRRKPDCAECLRELRSMLWTALPQPAPGTGQRGAGDRAGAAYLDSLRGTPAP